MLRVFGFLRGLDEEGNEKLVMFPADEKGNILDRKMKSLGAAANSNLKDIGRDDDPANSAEPCPPNCPNLDD